MRKKILASLTAALLVGSGVFSTTVAAADETPVEETQATEVVETPAPVVEEPVAETAPEQTEVATSDPAPTVVEEPATEQAPIVAEEVQAPAPAPQEAQANAPPAEQSASPEQAKVAPATTPATGLPENYPNDAARPFVLTPEGVTLTSGTFQANDHVNVRPGKGLHLDPNNNQPGGAFIGKTTVPWSALGLTAGTCVEWVQYSGANYHFGENNVGRGGVDERGWTYCIPKQPQPETVKVFVWWLLDKASTQAKPFVKPQTLISKGYEPKPTLLCGQIAQGDWYKGTQAQIDAVISDGILASSDEDASIYVSHEWLVGPKCTTTTVKVPDLPVNPPTCTEDGSLPWTSNPPAQNPNGYEFPGQGFRVYLDKAYTGPGTYVATVQKIGPGFDPAFWGGTKVEGNLKQTLTVLPAIGNQSTDPGAPCFVPPTNVCVPGEGDTSTNLNDLWVDVDTRSAGHREYVPGGLHVWTDDSSSQAKVSEGRALSFPLQNTGTLALDWDGSTPPPGINLFVDFGADGTGTLVYESVYGQDLWLTNGSSAAVKANAPVNGGGNGSQWHGTIDQWLAKYPQAQVTGVAYSLGSGVKGDGILRSLTVNCTVYAFDEAAIPEQPEPRVVHDEWTGDVCVEPLDGTAVRTTYGQDTTYPTTFDRESWTWVEGEGVVGEVYVISETAVDSEECAPPVVKPSAVISDLVCTDEGGAVDVTLDNSASEVDVEFTVWIDDEATETYPVTAGESDVYHFVVGREGTHTVRVTVGEEVIATKTVSVDCEGDEEPPVTPTPTPTPTTPSPSPTTPAPTTPVVTPAEPGLAVTGAQIGGSLLAVLALIGAGVALVIIRGRRTTEQ